MGAAVPSFGDIKTDFESLDDWEDRYRYLIELGRALPPLAASDRTDTYKVSGCASQVWLVPKRRHGDDGLARLSFEGDSDAHIVKGLVALLIALYRDRTPADALAIDARAEIAALGLDQHLTPQRSNGLASMMRRITEEASAALG
jgi:cysteine desulfuration protein SufE